MKRLFVAATLLIAVITLASSCTTVSGNYRASSNDYSNDLTVGKVQKEIRKGMSGSEVIESLGSPQIITADEQGLETWVYDKIATEVSYSKSNDVLFLILYAKSNTEASYSQTQRTLTVIVKLRDNKVESFSYHASKF